MTKVREQHAPLAQGATIGILGTGQLGRMMAMAAARLGFKTHIFGPERDPPAAQLANHHSQAAYEDETALRAFAGTCDVVTFEFENIPRSSLEALAGTVTLRPGLASLETSQDRLIEKKFLQGLGLTLAPYTSIDGPVVIAAAHAALGGDTILKTRRFGYDGKGQVRLRPGASVEGDALWRAVGQAPCVLEQRIAFTAEISAVIARGADSQHVAYDVPQNHHKDGILDTSSVGQFAGDGISDDLKTQAQQATLSIAQALNHIGVLTAEFFVSPQGTLLVNEIAPRVHNSGHWTMDACLHDQFDNHIRAVAGWPLGTAQRHSDAKMTNLIGADIDQDIEALCAGHHQLHLYGKAQARAGRKMGHINTLAPRLESRSN